MFLGLEQTQWLDRTEIERLQLAQVRSLLAHCVKNVPYYRRLLAAHGIAAESVQTIQDFRRIPILERRTFREQFSQISAGSLPEGIREAGKAYTSGTSGVPIEVLQTNLVNLWWQALLLRDHLWSDIDPRRTLASIRATAKTGAELDRLLQGVALPHWSRVLNTIIETGPAHFMDIHQHPSQQLAWLRKIEPDYLLSFPSNLEFLGGLIMQDGPRLRKLRMIQAISETLSEPTQKRIESAFGVPVKNTYSCSEAGYVASPCPDGQGLHVHAENVLVEVLDTQGLPCAPGQTGRVVLTTLQNFLCPFIRYEIADEAEVGAERCACGRGLPLLNRVLGKERPVLQLPDGRVKHSSALTIGLWRAGGFHQFQVCQRERDYVVVRLVPDRTWTEEHASRVTRAVHDFFEAPVRVQLELSERFELPRSGKLLAVVSELEPAASIS
jgi:phenylacetate-CoA ligase